MKETPEGRAAEVEVAEGAGAPGDEVVVADEVVAEAGPSGDEVVAEARKGAGGREQGGESWWSWK